MESSFTMESAITSKVQRPPGRLAQVAILATTFIATFGVLALGATVIGAADLRVTSYSGLGSPGSTGSIFAEDFPYVSAPKAPTTATAFAFSVNVGSLK